MRKKLHIRRKVAVAAMLAIVTVFASGMAIVPRFVAADTISDQIRQLQSENAANQDVVSRLRNEAVSYRDAITRLQSQITILQAQIDDNLTKQADLQAKIDASQRELERQKSILGENIRVMYVEGQISTVEMLATSKNLSDFVDREQYRMAIKNKIQDTLTRITQLQNEMKEQKVQIERLLKEQQEQQAQLDNGRAEQANMLNYNEAQQADYNNRTKANQVKIASLIAAQRRANETVTGGYYFLRFPGSAAPHDPSVNDYPYASWGFSMSTAPGCNDGDGPDRWGYCTNQCVSYAAWAVERSGRDAPRYYGNAKDWVAAAYRNGVPVFRDPEPGDVAINTSGTWGHAMYVEAVEGNRIFVSEYNGRLDGQYLTQWRTFR